MPCSYFKNKEWQSIYYKKKIYCFLIVLNLVHKEQSFVNYVQYVYIHIYVYIYLII